MVQIRATARPGDAGVAAAVGATGIRTRATQAKPIVVSATVVTSTRGAATTAMAPRRATAMGATT